jgi:hypothetical protein
MKEKKHIKQLPIYVWVIAILITPALAFVCLRISRAISTIESILGVSLGLIIHYGILSVLVKTNNNSLQDFVVLLYGTSFYLLFIWIYQSGLKGNIWSDKAKKGWKTAGMFFGGLLALGLFFSILGFHISQYIHLHK